MGAVHEQSPVRFADAVAGNEPGPREVGPITRTDIVRYQGASGDFQPVHHDEPFATAAGFPAPLAVGMFHAGVMTTWATDWLGPERVRRTRIRWKAPVFPGDTLTFHGAVEARDEAAATVDLTLTGTKQDGSVAVQGWMTFDLSA